MLVVGVDLDGIGHVFSAGVLDHLHCEGLEHLWKSGPTPDPYWDWYKDWGWTDQQFVEFCNRAADHGCLFTGHVREGFVETIQKIYQLRHYVVLITDRSFGSTPQVSQNLTVEWLRENDIPYDELIFSRDKTVRPTDVFVEDRIENYDALVGKGTNAFLVNRAWNRVDPPDYRKRIDSIIEFGNLIEYWGDRLKRKKVYISS